MYSEKEMFSLLDMETYNKDRFSFVSKDKSKRAFLDELLDFYDAQNYGICKASVLAERTSDYQTASKLHERLQKCLKIQRDLKTALLNS